jgi:hypothetical protein
MPRMQRTIAIVTVLAASLVACKSATSTADGKAAATATAADKGWVTLFDGGDLSKNFRGFRSDKVPSSWVVKDGCLVHMKGGNEHMAGGDLVTRDTYGSFELELEWKVTSGGNSGIFYHAMEDTNNI